MIRSGGIIASALLLALGSTAALAADLTIGEVHPITGPANYWGDPMHKAMQLAVDNINGAGGVTVGGETDMLTLAVADTQANPTAAVAALKKLMSDGVHLLVGPLSSGVAPALKPIVESSGDSLLLVDGAVVTGLPDGKVIFRNQPEIGDGYNYPLVEFIKQKGFPRVAIMLDKFHTGFVNSEPDMVKQMGGNGNQVVDEEQFKLKDTDFSAQLTNVLAAKPDALVVRGYPNEATLITKSARQLGYKGAIIWQAQAPAATILKNATNEEMQGVVSVFPPTAEEFAANGSKKASDFIDQYKAKYASGPGELSLFSYDAVMILKAALGHAKSADAGDMSTAMAALKIDDVPELINHYEPQQDGRLFNDEGQAVVHGTVHVWQDGGWTTKID